MQCSQVLSELALQRLLSHAQLNGDAPGAGRGLRNLLSECEPALTRALRDANARAWLAIEVVLAGEKLWECALRTREDALDASFYQPIRDLLDAVSWNDPAISDTNSRRRFWQALEAIQRTGLLTSGELPPAESSPSAEAASETNHREQSESAVLEKLAQDVEQAGYGDLRPLLNLRWRSGDSLLVLLVAALASSAIQTDPQLLESLGPLLKSDSKDAGIEDVQKLAALLQQHQARLDALLDEVRGATKAPPVPWLEAPDARLRRGLGFLQQADYEAAIAEFTAALKCDPSLVAAYKHRADVNRLRGQYPPALADYRSALRLDPSNAAAQLSRARVYLLLGQHREAIADYSAVIQLEPQNTLAYYWRGLAYVDAGDLDKAIDDFSATLLLDRQYTWAFHHRGDAYAAKGNYDVAISDYSDALKLDSSAAVSYLRRGDAFLFTKEYERAISDYGNVMRLDPLNVRAHAGRGIAHRNSGRLEQAIADFNRALALDPSNPTHYRERGIAYQLDGQPEQAFSSFDAALHLDQNDPHQYYLRGKASAEVGKADLALADLTEAIRRDPSHARAFHARGQLHADRGDLDWALRDYGAALQIDPSLTQALTDRARAFAQVNRLDEALADCNAALHQDPVSGRVHVIRGTVLVHRGDLASALQDLTRAVELDPKNSSAYYQRGLLRAKQADVPGALVDLTEAARLDPRSARIYAHRALVYWKAGKTEPALSDLAYAVQLDTRYAATYCNLRGMAHAAQGHYERAVADFTVTLQLEPRNANALTGRARYIKALEAKVQAAGLTSFADQPLPVTMSQELRMVPSEVPADVVTPKQKPAEAASHGTSPPGERNKPAAARSAAGVALKATNAESTGDTAVYDLERSEDSSGPSTPPDRVLATAQRLPDQDVAIVGTDSSAEFELASPEASADSAEFVVAEPAPETPDEPEPEPAPAVVESPEEEPEVDSKEQQQRRAQELRARYEAAKKETERKQAEATARAKKREKRRAAVADDDEDAPFHVRWRKQLISLAAAASVLLCLWYGWRWYKTPYRPPTPLQAEAVWELFKSDPIAANRKYGNQRFFVRGKLFIEKKVFNEPQRAFFKLASDDIPRLRCTFASVGEMVEEGTGETRGICIISGEFQPYLEGPFVEITQCEFLGSSPVSAAGSSALGSSIDSQLARSLGDSADLFGGPGTCLAPEATYVAALAFGLVRSDAATQCEWAHHRGE
jgi:tetratricopeptide (TPR) repeat protein